MEESKYSTEIVSKLASNIRHLRRQKSLSQGDLAEILGLNRGNIASYEKGTAEPRISNLINLADFYQVSVCDLTTVDLRCPIALKSARHNFHYELKEEDKASLNHFVEQAKELEEVLCSLKICNRFKVKCMKNIPEELQPVLANFDQLCSAGGMLMKAHKELLEFVTSRMK